jgi:hypothetical protein
MTKESNRRRRREAATHTRLAMLYLFVLNEADADSLTPPNWAAASPK